MKILVLSALLIMSVSCSRINVESQERYRQLHSESKTIRHGIIPLSTKAVVKIPDEASISRGKTLYINHCLACHGESGKGNGPKALEQKSSPINLQKLVQEVPDFDFFISISNWQGDMPGWKEKFNSSELEDIKSYLKTLKTN